MPFELPPELWLHIFKDPILAYYLSQLQSVCRLFRNLSRPLLFSKFELCIWGEDNPDSIESDDLDSDSKMASTELEALEFWSSETISPYVRSCRIMVLDPAPIIWDSPTPILAACFEAISRFANLREFTWGAKSIQISSLRLDALPFLERMYSVSAAFVPPPDVISSKLRLTHFAYAANSNPSSDAPSSYLSFLDLASLRYLRLSWPKIAPTPLQGDMTLMSSFQHLHTLDLDFNMDTTFTQLHTYLSPFPAIRYLMLRAPKVCTADALPGSGPVPQLRRYNGPSKLLPLILRRATPTDIMLTDVSARGLLAPLLDSGAETRRCIISLELSAAYREVSEPVLRSILRLFPHLTAVTVNIFLGKDATEEGTSPATSSPMEGAPALFEPLIDALRAPGALTTAVLRWWMSGGPDEVVPDLELLHGALLSRVSSLVEVSSLIEDVPLERYRHVGVAEWIL